MQTLRISLQVADPITYAGLASQLEHRPELVISDDPPPCDVDVVVFATERISSDKLSTLRRWAEVGSTPIVMITSDMPESDLLSLVESSVVAVIPRGAISGKRLAGILHGAATGSGFMPPDVLGELLNHVRRIQREILAPRGLNALGFTPREVEVLRLLADGLDTEEIARDLRYSERTVKNIMYSLNNRLNLRNRAHAVAYALRAGVI